MCAPEELERFWDKLARAPERVLLLDYDGTLAPFRAERDLAAPYPGVREILDTVTGEGCRLVIISGRAARDLLPLLRLDRQPEIWGSHGIERLYPDGRYEIAATGKGRETVVNDNMKRAMEEAARWAQGEGLGERCEKKPAGVALHWRGLGAEEAAKLRAGAKDAWEVLTADSGMILRDFDGGLELRPGGLNKGDAINAILAESHSDAVAAYLGDDLTDEDAFRAIKGRGLAVLVHEEWRPTGADLWLKPPGQLTGFLRRWRDVCSRKR